MAQLWDLDQAKWEAWLASRPDLVREIAQALPPNLLYRLKTTGQRVTLYSVSEDGSVTVDITGDFNLIDFDRRVFGINPNDLEECDLPGPEERLGTRITDPEKLEVYIEHIRPLILAQRRADANDPYGKRKQ